MHNKQNTYTHRCFYICMHVQCVHYQSYTHISSPVKSRSKCVCPAGRPLTVLQHPPAVSQSWSTVDITHLLPDFLTGWNRWARGKENHCDHSQWGCCHRACQSDFILLFSTGRLDCVVVFHCMSINMSSSLKLDHWDMSPQNKTNYLAQSHISGCI